MLIVGHRGARGEAPENTLTGFRHLRHLSLRCVEFDVQVSGDDQLVVIHDDAVDRTTNASGPLRGFTAAQMGRLDARGAFPHWPEATGIPTLADCLGLLGDFDMLQVEVKAHSPQDVSVMLAKLPPLLDRARLQHRATVTSQNVEFLLQLHAQRPDLALGLVAEYPQPEPITTCLTTGCRMLVLNRLLCTPKLVQQAHSEGLHVSVWTVNDAPEMARIAACGADSLITDLPALALQQDFLKLATPAQQKHK